MNRGLSGRVRKRGCEQGRAAAACEKREKFFSKKVVNGGFGAKKGL